MAGLIKSSKDDKPQKNPPEKSSLKTIEQWLLFLGETYGHKWNAVSMSGYRFALEDLTPEQLDRACKETLRTWQSNSMPAPGFVRSCLKNHAGRREEFLGVPQLTYPEISQEERDAAIDDPEYQATKQKALEAEIHIVAKKKASPARPAKPMNALLRDERIDELEKQRQEILERFPAKAS